MKYFNKEGTYSSNFSNVYPKGTNYSIKGVSTAVAIALQGKESSYMKANNDGEYAGNKNNFWNIGSSTIITGTFVLIAIMGIYL